jgi:3-oxoacyl-[acyl-carrier protein] reductase
MLGASFLSTVIGTRLPGPGALWLSQTMDFLHPVRLGDRLTVRCTVEKKHPKERLLDLATVIVNQDRKEVLRGSGRVKMLICERDKPAPASALSKVAIVTGGGGGIGSAICQRLAREGFAVVINYRNESGRADEAALLIEAAGGRAIAVQADITTLAGAGLLYEVAQQRYGTGGVLVHSASARVVPLELAALAWDDLQGQLDVQLKGALLMIQQCVPGMAAQGTGRIVLLTSQAIAGQPSLHWTAYASAKAALAMLSRSLAVELGASGITVNCVSPGMTETSMIGDIPEKIQMMTARQTPLRRLARPEDVAGAVAYLVSQDAAFVSGQTLAVDGGLVAG